MTKTRVLERQPEILLRCKIPNFLFYMLSLLHYRLLDTLGAVWFVFEAIPKSVQVNPGEEINGMMYVDGNICCTMLYPYKAP